MDTKWHHQPSIEILLIIQYHILSYSTDEQISSYYLSTHRLSGCSQKLLKGISQYIHLASVLTELIFWVTVIHYCKYNFFNSLTCAFKVIDELTMSLNRHECKLQPKWFMMQNTCSDSSPGFSFICWFGWRFLCAKGKSSSLLSSSEAFVAFGFH